MTPGFEPLALATRSAEETRSLGAALGADLRAGDLLILNGELGAGKTTLVQGIAEGMGARGRVTSPTYIIARVHPTKEGSPDLVHVDAYRVDGELDLETIDLDATLDQAVTVVEWGAGKVEGLSEDRLEIDLDFADKDEDDEGRTVTLRPVGQAWQGRLGQEVFPC